VKLSKEILKQRTTANRAIAVIVFAHVALVLLAASFHAIWLTRMAVLSGAALYLAVGPCLWLWHRTTLPDWHDEGLSDIRDSVGNSLPKYDPEQHFDLKRGIFMGLKLDGDHEPIFVPWKTFRKTHMQVVGTTGSGKGVATTMLLIQSALDGECVVVFDPKDDEFAPNVMARAAANAKIPFHLIDLRPSAPPQFNIFRGSTQTEIEELLMTAFDMGDKGNSADFYRLFDRAAARDVCARSGQNPTMRALVTVARSASKDVINDEKGLKFVADLEELAGLQAINTTEGLDLEAILSQQGFLYIIGSIRNVQTVRCQKMLLLRLMQIIEKRDRTANLRYIAMMLDELKYLLSKPALQALGTVRDKYCHIILAHQSLADLRDCEGLDPQAVSGAVVENTSMKLIYKAVSPETAEWASALSGSIVVTQRSSHMQQGMFDAANGQLRETERALLTENDILTMPPLVGMLFGDGLAKRAQVAPMKAGKRPTVTQASKYVSPNDGRKNKQEKQKKAGEQPQPDDNAQGKAQEMAVELVEEIAPAQALVAEPERDTEAVTVAKSNVGDGIR